MGKKKKNNIKIGLVILFVAVGVLFFTGYNYSVAPTKECSMISSDMCEAFKAGSTEHILVTRTESNPPNHAIPAGEYNKCEVTYEWTLPSGRYGQATGSGLFTLEGIIIDVGDVRACKTNPSSQEVSIYEDGIEYIRTFGHLGSNMDWTEKARFYTAIVPDCVTNSDCPQDSCFGYECIGGNCIEIVNIPDKPCSEAVWVGYPDCLWDESECGFKISDYLPFIVIGVSVMVIVSVLIFARKQGLF